jgi:hypothetical protein
LSNTRSAIKPSADTPPVASLFPDSSDTASKRLRQIQAERAERERRDLNDAAALPIMASFFQKNI